MIDAVTTASGAVGAVFCVAAVAKFISGPASLESFLASASVPRGLRVPVARLLPYAEFIVGALVIAVPGAWTLASASVLATAFLAALVWARWRGVRTSCHCFGAIDTVAGHTPVPLIRAAILAASSAAALGAAVGTGQAAGAASMPSTAVGILVGAAFVAIASLGGQVWGLRILHADMMAQGVILGGRQ
jgi:hypothetical protein